MLIQHPHLIAKHIMAETDILSTILSLFPKVLTTLLFAWAISAYHITILYLGLTPFWFWFTELTGWGVCLLGIYTYFKIIWVGPGSPLDHPELRYHTRKAGLGSGSEVSNPEEESLLPHTEDVVAVSNQCDHPAPAIPLPQSEQPSSQGICSLKSNSGVSVDPIEPPPTHIMEQHPLHRRGHRGLNLCLKCQVWKPDRAHHCSSCRRCILRMDHHCPWFACCIGFHNHKYFVQYLYYVTAFSFICFVVSFYNLYLFLWQEQLYANEEFLSINSVMLFVVSIAFTLAVATFAIFLTYLVLKNVTTIEFQSDDGARRSFEYDSLGKRKKLGNIYNLGWRENWRQVMGDSWSQWLLPINATSTQLVPKSYNNGINFEIDPITYENWCRNVFLQDRLDDQLQSYRNKLILNRQQGDDGAVSPVTMGNDMV